MRAVLGFVFLLGGFFVAWLVLSGKFPASGATSTTPGTTPPTTLPPTQQGNKRGGPGSDEPQITASNGGMSLPTMRALSHQASVGGMT